MKEIFATKSATPLKIDREKTAQSWLAMIATFILPIGFVVFVLFVMVSYRGGIEAGIANLALFLPVSYAFGAGMVASANPCGVLMLPSYIFYQIREEKADSSPIRRLWKSLVLATVVTSGFVIVFAVVGIIIAAGGQWLVAAFPYVGIIIAIGMLGLGIWILTSGKTIGLLDPKRFWIEPKRNLGNAFVFGIVYAFGSLSCTLPIFLVVVGTSIVGDSILSSFGQFIGYAFGMGLIIFIVTIGAALFRRAMARWIRLVTPYIHRISAMFLLGAGAYLIYYWVFQVGV
jgi:cytochrome c-type biogenesis protein